MYQFMVFPRENRNYEGLDQRTGVDVTTTLTEIANKQTHRKEDETLTVAQSRRPKEMVYGTKRMAVGCPEIPSQKRLPPHLASGPRENAGRSSADFKEHLARLNDVVKELKNLKIRHPATHPDIKSEINNMELAAWSSQEGKKPEGEEGIK